MAGRDAPPGASIEGMHLGFESPSYLQDLSLTRSFEFEFEELDVQSEAQN
jgi:hypothetical protein